MRDLRFIFAIQALRAGLYGFSSVLIGTALAGAGFSDAEVGFVFTAMLAGMALVSVAVGFRGDRLGRRRTYVALLLVMGAAGAVFAATTWLPALVLAALTGTLSTDPNESGPITSVEQAMLAGAPPLERARVFGRYNAVAYLAGAAGALAAGGPALLRDVLPAVPSTQRWLGVFPVVALGCAALATRLSGGVDAPREAIRRRSLDRSRGAVARLAVLFAMDSFGGGFVVQTFLVYWFRTRFGASVEVMGLAFFATGLLNAGSAVAAGRLAGRIGLLNTMVFTHLPSNVLLAAIPFAPTLPGALGLLLGRSALSQMDVPARQAYVVTIVDPDERLAAAAVTNTARYVARPAGPAVAGILLQVAQSAPFVVAGAVKVVYDLALFAMFRRVSVPTGRAER